ncbi:MAG: glycine zipper domain-containing protein [Chitinophagaceae bacterium]
MKKFILVVAVAASLGACKSREEKTLDAQSPAATETVKQPVVVQREVHYVTQPAQPAAQTQKKGWSKAATGAVIGGTSGAAVGALVSKKKGKGAVIGGVVGAGAGYLIGRSKDKKDGRVQ